MEETLHAQIDPATGILSFEGRKVSVGKGLREADMQGLAGMGLKRSEATMVGMTDGKCYEFPAVHYETPTVMLGGRAVKLWFCFRSGVLTDISVAIVGLEWWSKEGHKENIALRDKLFSSRRKFSGGRVRVWFEPSRGALYDGGSNFSLIYDPPDTGNPGVSLRK